MKILLFLTTFLAVSLSVPVFAGITGSGDWGSATNNIELRIGLDGGERQIKTNQSFQLLIHIRNTSTNSPFYFLSPLAIFNGEPFTFEVISPSAKDIAPAPPKVERGSAEVITVRPNQDYKCNFNLGYLCKFNEVGTYKILAKMNVGMVKSKKIWAISNPLFVIVVSDTPSNP